MTEVESIRPSILQTVSPVEHLNDDNDDDDDAADAARLPPPALLRDDDSTADASTTAPPHSPSRSSAPATSRGILLERLDAGDERGGAVIIARALALIGASRRDRVMLRDRLHLVHDPTDDDTRAAHSGAAEEDNKQRKPLW